MKKTDTTAASASAAPSDATPLPASLTLLRAIRRNTPQGEKRHPKGSQINPAELGLNSTTVAWMIREKVATETAAEAASGDEA